jgi:hypothetical protein
VNQAVRPIFRLFPSEITQSHHHRPSGRCPHVVLVPPAHSDFMDKNKECSDSGTSCKDRARYGAPCLKQVGCCRFHTEIIAQRLFSGLRPEVTSRNRTASLFEPKTDAPARCLAEWAVRVRRIEQVVGAGCRSLLIRRFCVAVANCGELSCWDDRPHLKGHAHLATSSSRPKAKPGRRREPRDWQILGGRLKTRSFAALSRGFLNTVGRRRPTRQPRQPLRS